MDQNFCRAFHASVDGSFTFEVHVTCMSVNPLLKDYSTCHLHILARCKPRVHFDMKLIDHNDLW